MAQTDIDELLNSIKAENEVNGERFVKAFDEITAKLDDMASGSETEALVRECLLSLKVELENRYRSVIEKFESVKDSFEVINEKQDLLTKNSDLKIMFNILNENIDHFIQNVSEQKSMIGSLEQKLDDFRNDSSKKDEIIEQVLTVKENVDDVKRGLESSIMEVNSSLRNITKTLMTMDVTDQNDIIKRELENIYLATNAILSSIEIFDQKNDDIAKNIVTKEDLINLSGKMDSSFALVSEKFDLINGNEQIVSEIQKNREQLKSIGEDISAEIGGYLTSFKVVLSDCLDNIAKNQPATSSESDLTVSKKFEILENLSKDIKAVETSLNSQSDNSAVLINTRFKDLESIIENFKKSVASENIELETELSSKISDLEAGIKQISLIIADRFEKWQEFIGKTIDSVNDMTSFNDYKVNEFLGTVSDLKSKFEVLSADFSEVSSIAGSKLSNIEKCMSEDIVDFKAKLSGIDENISSFKSSLEHSTIENKECFTELLNEISTNIRVVISELKNDEAQSGLESIRIQIDGLNAQFENLKGVFLSVSSENVEKILGEIKLSLEKSDENFQKIASVIGSNFDCVSQNIDKAIIENKQNFECINSKIETLSDSNTEKIVAKLENLEVSAFESKRNLEGLSSKIEAFSTDESDKIVSKLESIESKIDMTGVDIATELDTNVDLMKEFIDEYRHDNVKGSEEILTLSDNIKNLELELVENSNKFNSAIGIQLNDLNNCVLSLKDLCENDDGRDVLLKQAETLQSVEGSLNVISEKFNENFVQLQNKVVDYSKAVADIAVETKGKLGLSLEEINSVKFELTSLLEKISENKNEYSGRFDEISGVIVSKFDDISEIFKKAQNNSLSELDTAVRNNLLNIEDKFVELRGLLSENSENLENNLQNSNSELIGKIDDLRQEIGLINTDLSDIISTKAEALVDSFVPLKETIDTFVENEFDKLVDNIKSQVELACLNFSADVNESLAENHDNYVHLEEAYNSLVDKFSEVQTVIHDLNKNQIRLMVETIREVDKTQSDNFENTNSLINSWKTELEEIQERLELRLTGFEGAIKRGFLEQKTASEFNKKEIKSAIEPLLKKDEFEAEILQHSAQLQELISDNSSDLKFGITNSINEIKSEILRISEKSGLDLSNLKSIVDKLDEKSDSFAMANQAEQIEELVKSLNEKIDILAMSSDAEVLQDMVTELHEKVDILAMSSDAEIVQDMLSALNEKVDVLAAVDDDDLYNEIQDIKDLINEQRKQIEDFGSEGSDFDKRLQSLLTEISNIDLEKSASDIKDSVMNAVLTMTDQISFAEETEAIKGFVEERTDEINKNLLDVKKQLCSIASGSDAWDYSYTMQDIESDIAKLRLILNDISASTSKEDLNEISKNMHKLAASVNTLHTTLTEEQINELKDNVLKINEDVVSLSTRTNKLLLNSDESHKALTDGIEELNRVLSILGNGSVSEVIEKKLDNINAAIATSADTDNTMREVMLYLGEWIDDASEKLNTIASDTSNLSSITSELCYLKSMIGNSDIIESIRKKFEVQQERIDTLEVKLDRLMELFDNNNSKKIENKIDLFESRIDLFIQKMDSFDKKLRHLDDKFGKLSEGLEKLVSYVD